MPEDDPDVRALSARLDALAMQQQELLRLLGGENEEGDTGPTWLRGELEELGGEGTTLIESVRRLRRENDRLREQNERLQERVTTLEGVVDGLREQVGDTGQMENVEALVRVAARLRDDAHQSRVVLSIENIRLACDVSERRAYQLTTDYPERFGFLRDRREHGERLRPDETGAGDRPAGLLVDLDAMPGRSEAPALGAIRERVLGD